MFFFNETATTYTYTYCHTLSLHDALPVWARSISSMYEGRALLAVSRGPRVRVSGGVVGVPGLLAAAAFALTKAEATAAGVTLCWAGRRRSSAWMASPSARARARSRMFSSSRTLPGKG